MAGVHAEVRGLIKHVRDAGYKVAKTGNGAHYKVLTKSGQPVVDDDGPLIFSGSPSERRWREMHVQRFMAAGVLKKDPYKATREGDTEGRKKKGIADTAVRERIQREQRERSEKARDETILIRSRLAPIIAKLGGWGGRSSLGVTAMQFADVCFWWAVQEQRAELPPTNALGEPTTVDHVRLAVERLKKPGETVQDRFIPLLREFVTALESDAGEPPQPEVAAETYRTLLRKSRQLPVPGAFDEDDVFEPEERTLHDELLDINARHNGNGAVVEQLGPLYASDDILLTPLAAEVLYHINPAATDLETALSLVSRIARIERREQ